MSDEGPKMLPGRARRTVPRPSEEAVRALSEFPVSIVSDCMNRMGVMDASIHSLAPGRSFCGVALTVEEVEASNIMSHAASAWIQPGDVLVIDAKGATTRSCWGGLQTRMAEKRGAAALVINGAVRDVEDVRASSLPVFALGTSPGGPLKGWGGNINYPIACGGVPVLPGDVVMGDDDGVVVVPQDLVTELPPLCRRRVAAEAGWFERIEDGQSTLDAVGLHDKLAALKIRFED